MANGLLDGLVTSALARWTWSDLGAAEFPDTLTDYRPADIETVREMMSGRYLFAARLVDTNGVSPFSLSSVHPDWYAELHSFAWLRHFRDARNEGERRFARTLALDWIGRHRAFDRKIWSVALTSHRVLNWLRHLSLLTDEAGVDKTDPVPRMLSQQIQSLRVRVPFVNDPRDAFLAHIALLAAALCDGSPPERVGLRLQRLEELMKAQIDEDGLHRSRNPSLQVDILSELVTVRQSLGRHQVPGLESFGTMADRMHAVLAALTIGTGELTYFNGCGQQQVDLVYALQAQGIPEAGRTGVISGYGTLRSGSSIVVADSGVVPEPTFSKQAHAGGLAFEFSSGTELIVGNCGPAPSSLSDSARLFRLGAAHSGPTVGRQSLATIQRVGPYAGHLQGMGAQPFIEVDPQEMSLHMRHEAYLERFGVITERWLTLISNGETLVGQDRFSVPSGKPSQAPGILRFHLGPGVEAERSGTEEIVHLSLPSGARWSFLWEGSAVTIEDSVRQSAYFGFYRTKQIVLETQIGVGTEIAWILTRQS